MSHIKELAQRNKQLLKNNIIPYKQAKAEEIARRKYWHETAVILERKYK